MNPDERLPLFPLGIVVYPGEPVPLHIFEFRYREMVRLCLEEQRAFGIVLMSDAKLAQVGCTVRIERVLKRYDDGRSDILCRGEQRFRIAQVYREKPYLTAAAVGFEPDGAGVADADTAARERLITQHMKLLEIAGEEIRPTAYQTATPISFVVARNAGLELDQKQDLLEMLTEKERLAFLTEHLESLLKRVSVMKEVKRRAQGDGYAGSLPSLE
ncbi:MAG: LON peptidase substrate-binding domain-containing protein [Bacteroidota bacterium]